MPWLIKDKIISTNNLFFVHIPRSGGTSMMKHFSIPSKTTKGRNLIKNIPLLMFFARYELHETCNYSLLDKTDIPTIVVFLLGVGISQRSCCCGTTTTTTTTKVIGRCLGFVVATLAVVRYVMQNFLHVPATCARSRVARRITDEIAGGANSASVEWCTGANRDGYVMHLTVPKLLRLGYIKAEQWEKTRSFAIVRNPYSRFVSLYLYNRFGPLESFEHFVKQWYDDVMIHYRERREMADYYLPSHAVPQFEFTHHKGKQIVQCIVKTEELKYFCSMDGDAKKEAEAKDPTLLDIDPAVRKAFVNLPHVNGRTYSKKWYEYYNQETLNMVYEMYRIDFKTFGYDATLKQRPDLCTPAGDRGYMTLYDKIEKVDAMVRNVEKASDDVRSARVSLIKEMCDYAETNGIVPNKKVAVYKKKSKSMMPVSRSDELVGLIPNSLI